MNRNLAAVILSLASLPCAYAGFVYGWQLVSFAGFAVRIGEDMTAQTWGQMGLVAAQMAIIASALLIVWQGAGAANYRKALIALAVAWLASAPLLILFLSTWPLRS